MGYTPPRHTHVPPRYAHPLATHAPPLSGYYEMRPMSGRYASYWNAFLFGIICVKKVHENEKKKLDYYPSPPDPPMMWS